MSDELRPCPFCGKPMNVFKSEDYEDNFPWKGSCEGECLYTVEDLTKADVIAVISRRPIEDALGAEFSEARADAERLYLAVKYPDETEFVIKALAAHEEISHE